MDTSLTSYIDNSIIREHSLKTRDGLSLYINDLNDHEQENFLTILFSTDPVTKDILLDRAQELIDERLSFVEAEDNYRNGLYPHNDQQTGEIKWFPRRGAI